MMKSRCSLLFSPSFPRPQSMRVIARNLSHVFVQGASSEAYTFFSNKILEILSNKILEILILFLIVLKKRQHHILAPVLGGALLKSYLIFHQESAVSLPLDSHTGDNSSRAASIMIIIPSLSDFGTEYELLQ